MNIPCLGHIPYIRRSSRQGGTLIYRRIQNSGFGETVQLLRMRVEKAMSEQNWKVLLISSAIPGEGKTTIATNLALSMAHQGKKVLLVDCDLRNPSLERAMRMKKQKGLAEYITGDITAQDLIRPTKVENLYLIGGGLGGTGRGSDMLVGKRLAHVIRSICVHGKGPRGKYDNVRVGVNSRLDTLQAAILLPKFKALEAYEIAERQTVANRYNEAFKDHFTTPFVQENCQSVYAQYALLAKDTETRDRVIAHLSAKKIPNMIYYPTPQHALPVFGSEPAYGEKFTNADDYCARTLSLPMHPYLGEEEQQIIIDAVLEAL